MSADDLTYTLTAEADAPIAAVWAAWTEDEPYEAWSYSKAGSVSMDPTPNGRYTATVVTPDGQEFPITGRYIEVVEHELLLMGMDTPGGGEEVMRLDLVGLGEDRTRLTISQTCATKEEYDMAKEGSQMLLDSCLAYLAKA
ncbi:SRPBCC domain-containing protein [Glycomyces luteolus]|uniref:SRPBCC domain-containing protein n=1 Tax=Glycomyces luteolus TaxID=2670330 RepID=A0A9X3SP69_9ACTN|nr:SRPBCC domain-containing protein [Glycomyces luteolus]MDA1359037.1 SRPBCC domain-containing protein [Glycomyces luteolus]